ncbi:hypothetical protein QTP86_012464 [Hemibagrus guttatus]|nr:hypothetical protein QTP86_012464 [Hemibagrus guttatus]
MVDRQGPGLTVLLQQVQVLLLTLNTGGQQDQDVYVVKVILYRAEAGFTALKHDCPIVVDIYSQKGAVTVLLLYDNLPAITYSSLFMVGVVGAEKARLSVVSLGQKDASEPLDLSEVIQELQVKQRLELWCKMSSLLTHTLHSYPSERWISRLEQDGDDMEVEQSAELLSELNRLYSLRDVLLSVEFDSERGQYITNTLLQCFLSTNHIKREEGKRFLAFLFSWDVGFIKMIHETIKNQLQFLSKAVAEDVAEIYFRAWKKASSPFLEEIESSCIQDLMQHAILLHRTSPVQGKVRQQDNAPCHKAKMLQEWFDDHNNQFEVLTPPPNSPDLNPIQHLWDKQVRSMETPPHNLQDLKDLLLTSWCQISQHTFRDLVESMPRRILAYLHKQKFRQGVDEMLHRLYMPILWKALRVKLITSHHISGERRGAGERHPALHRGVPHPRPQHEQ